MDRVGTPLSRPSLGHEGRSDYSSPAEGTVCPCVLCFPCVFPSLTQPLRFHRKQCQTRPDRLRPDWPRTETAHWDSLCLGSGTGKKRADPEPGKTHSFPLTRSFPLSLILISLTFNLSISCLALLPWAWQSGPRPRTCL